jgi:hypothetical protein
MNTYVPSDRAPDLRADRPVVHPCKRHETFTVAGVDPCGDERPLLGLRSHE